MTSDWPNAYIGLPYDRVNCWQLAVRVLKEQAGIDIPTYSERYTSPREAAEISALISEVGVQTPWMPVDAQQAQALDIVVTWIRNPRTSAHVGIVIQPGTMLTTHATTGCVLVSYLKRHWAGRVAGIYRHEELQC